METSNWTWISLKYSGLLPGKFCNCCLAPAVFSSLILPSAVPQVIAAEGEMNASRALKEASIVISESPAALQLRYLQTLTTIAAEKNSTIVFPLPIDMLQGMMRGNQ